MTQKAAAEELGITERHVGRLLYQLKKRGDQTVAHALRGLPSNRKIAETERRRAIRILSQEVWRGFGPALAAEYRKDKRGVAVRRETVPQWMSAAKLWRSHPRQVEKVHQWRRPVTAK